ncbi:MAG: hypothetical protein ACD_40C00176G0001 [uncultured bacterium]|nr:MAG: hypothetical protein ACD_40C00176G0001 [uncultured bacterium]
MDLVRAGGTYDAERRVWQDTSGYDAYMLTSDGTWVFVGGEPTAGAVTDENGQILDANGDPIDGTPRAPTEGVGILNFANLERGVQHDLTALELKGLGLSGEGFAVTGQYEGVDINIVMMSANGLLATVDGQKGIRLNPVYPEGQGSPADRLAQAVLAGHWRGYQEDHGAISLAQFVADLKAGKDMSYTLTGAKVGENRLGTITVDPSKPIEIVGTVDEHDPNGDSWVHHTSHFGYGYFRTADGGLRLVVRLPESYNDPVKAAYIFMSSTASALWTLGLDEKQQGSGSELNNLPKDIDKYDDYKEVGYPMWYVRPSDPSFQWGDTIIVTEE